MNKQKLKEYKKKRKFDVTPEPAGKVKRSSGLPKFVIQKHAARRLHYDFRLELNGVLISWAVPKQPSMNSGINRLAMKVEDHPLDYMYFEGTIPEGNYGAGTVMVWDKGEYHTPASKDRQEVEKQLNHQLEEGKIKIVLNGEKLQGEFTLVRLKNGEKDKWLLKKITDGLEKEKDSPQDYSVISGKDMVELSGSERVWTGDGEEKIEKISREDLKGAKRGQIKGKIKPMMARLIDRPFTDKEWIFELKYDGYRAIADNRNDRVELYSRNHKSFANKYPELINVIKNLPFEGILDGEIAVANEKGITRFEWLQNYGNTKQGQLIYYVFDLLWYEGYDLRNLPLLQRKNILRKLIPNSPLIKYSDHIAEKGQQMYHQGQKVGLEGIIGKKTGSRYEEGKRSGSWVKLKILNQQEAVICGYTDPQGSRKVFGSLILGAYEGNKLKYIGNVGTGFNQQDLENLGKKFRRRKTSPFEEFDPRRKNMNWVRPELVCEVRFTEWTEDGKMRHPAFLGLRDDKDPKNVKLERSAETSDIKQLSKVAGKFEITNREKEFWPEGYTKGDVIDHYNQISDYILPYLTDRPESLRRNPDGLATKAFFQKNMKGKVPGWVKTQKIYSESNDEVIEYMLCQDKETLLYMANLGCIEINPWSSTIHHLDKPDYFIFDLDPLDIPFQKVVEVALELRNVMETLQLTSYIKTSGGKGLHVYLPAGAKYSYDQTRDFVHLIVRIVHQRLPGITSLERLPSKRKGKVYLDYLQNGRGKTMAAPYALRPKPGAPVSTPLEWSEVNKKLNPLDFNIRTIRKRLDAKGDLWQGLLGKGINMNKALKIIEDGML